MYNAEEAAIFAVGLFLGVSMYLLAQLPADVLRTQFGNGVILMILGMAIVFVFLTILVFTTKLVSKIVQKIESKRPQTLNGKPEVVVNSTNCDAEVAAALAAAVAKSKS